MNIALFRLTGFSFGIIFMLFIETISPARPWQNPRKLRLLFHLTIAILNTIILRFPAVLPLLLLRKFVNFSN